MIIAVDIETQGLDATKYVLGCIIKEGRKKPELYRNKKKLWKRIIQLGEQEAKRNKMLNVYMHNAPYDFYGYADLNDKHIEFFNHNPFIVSYNYNKEECEEKGIPWKNNKPEWQKKEIIKFLDTYSIYKMNLEKLGKMIDLPKYETPKELLQENQKITPETIEKIKPYIIRDTEIVLRSIQNLKEKLKKEKINVKRLYTINQIAINYLINTWRKKNNTDHIFWDKKRGELRRTLRAEEIHGAYRGGKVHAEIGKYKNTTNIDCNSLYPYSSLQIKFPDLRSERKLYNPLKTKKIEEIITRIGISRVLMQNINNEIGLIPVRTSTGNYYPKKNKYIIGTYTNMELEKAIKEGYKIIDMEWTITYDEHTENLFEEYMIELYRKRKESKTEFDNYFYKMMMNGCLGKLAQTRTNQKMIIDSVEEAEKYLKENYKILKGIKYNYIYQEPKNNNGKPKKYYAPILPTLVNAYARIYMYNQYKKVKEHIIYTDTDSILTKGNHTHKFKISDKMGDFKIEHKNQEAHIYGKKTLRIGNDIKISGFKKKNMTIEDFELGIIKDKKMITINTTDKIEDIGKFKEETRDLNKQSQDYKEIHETLEQTNILIDKDIEDITYFLPTIEKIEVW